LRRFERHVCIGGGTGYFAFIIRRDLGG